MSAAGLDPRQLLALLWPKGEGARDIPAPAAPEEWGELDRMAGQHRLRPLLHARASLGGPLAFAPEASRQTWARAHRRSGLASLRQRAELQRVTQLLASAGIGSAVLKGGSFVWSGWFDPALRPMRDLDLLVQPEQAACAYRLLQNHGFTGPGLDHFERNRSAGKHLPGLTARDSGLLVELHVGLMDHFNPRAQARAEAFREAARHIPLPGAGEHAALIQALSPTDTLLHLLVHGVLDHQFNNGPLLIYDVAALIRHGAIDWGRFWLTVDALKVRQACQLGLLVAGSWEPDLGIEWDTAVPEGITPGLLQAASSMMLVDTRHHRELNWLAPLVRSDGVERRSRLNAMLGRGWRRAVLESGGAGFPEERTSTSAASRFSRRCLGVALQFFCAAQRMMAKTGRRHIGHGFEVAKWLARESVD